MSLPSTDSDTNPYTTGTDGMNVEWWQHISPLEQTSASVFKIETIYFTNYLYFCNCIASEAELQSTRC